LIKSEFNGKIFTCGENVIAVGKYPQVSSIESTRIVTCKVVIAHWMLRE